jgi:uncharacterized alpha-E superfamily protein
MLSRVAEQLYWFARYIERAENTARLINVNFHLLLDLPRRRELGWQSLIDITGSNQLFLSHYQNPDERSVIRFLVSDKNNPSSIQSCLFFARENLRTTRDIVPRETWELVNDMHLFLKNNIANSLSRNRRYEFLRAIIRGSHQITGLLAGTMSHDHGYEFLRMGRNLERADMTTRIIDVRSADLLPRHDKELTPFENIQWVSVLKSLTAYQMYRQHMKQRVRGADVLRFLLQVELFPRSYAHCLHEVQRCVETLPGGVTLRRNLITLRRGVREAKVHRLASGGLHEYINQLQAQLAAIHHAITDRYFLSGAPP